jgi:plasmid stability protein
MSTLTIRNLDDSVKSRLRVEAARAGCSMEEYVRRMLAASLAGPGGDRPLGTWMHELFTEAGGVDLDLPERTELPRAPDLAS